MHNRAAGHALADGLIVQQLFLMGLVRAAAAKSGRKAHPTPKQARQTRVSARSFSNLGSVQTRRYSLHGVRSQLEHAAMPRAWISTTEARVAAETEAADAGGLAETAGHERLSQMDRYQRQGEPVPLANGTAPTDALGRRNFGRSACWRHTSIAVSAGVWKEDSRIEGSEERNSM